MQEVCTFQGALPGYKSTKCRGNLLQTASNRTVMSLISGQELQLPLSISLHKPINDLAEAHWQNTSISSSLFVYKQFCMGNHLAPWIRIKNNQIQPLKMISLQRAGADMSCLTLHFSTLKNSNHQFSTGPYLGKRMVNPCSTPLCVPGAYLVYGANGEPTSSCSSPNISREESSCRVSKSSTELAILPLRLCGDIHLCYCYRWRLQPKGSNLHFETKE